MKLLNSKSGYAYLVKFGSSFSHNLNWKIFASDTFSTLKLGETIESAFLRFIVYFYNNRLIQEWKMQILWSEYLRRQLYKYFSKMIVRLKILIISRNRLLNSNKKKAKESFKNNWKYITCQCVNRMRVG